MLNEIAPARIAPTAANYAHAICTDGAARWLHTSGILPIGPAGSVADGIDEQAAVVWENIAAILGGAAMSHDDVVSVTTYVVEGQDLAPVMAARDRALGSHRAASTLVVVAALARPEWLVEVAIVAAR